MKFTTKDDDDSPEEAKEEKPEDLTRSVGPCIWFFFKP